MSGHLLNTTENCNMLLAMEKSLNVHLLDQTFFKALH